MAGTRPAMTAEAAQSTGIAIGAKLPSDPRFSAAPIQKQRVLRRKRRRFLAAGEKLVIIGVGDQVAILAVGETGALHCH